MATLPPDGAQICYQGNQKGGLSVVCWPIWHIFRWIVGVGHSCFSTMKLLAFLWNQLTYLWVHQLCSIKCWVHQFSWCTQFHFWRAREYANFIEPPPGCDQISQQEALIERKSYFFSAICELIWLILRWMVWVGHSYFATRWSPNWPLGGTHSVKGTFPNCLWACGWCLPSGAVLESNKGCA